MQNNAVDLCFTFPLHITRNTSYMPFCVRLIRNALRPLSPSSSAFVTPPPPTQICYRDMGTATTAQQGTAAGQSSRPCFPPHSTRLLVDVVLTKTTTTTTTKATTTTGEKKQSNGGGKLVRQNSTSPLLLLFVQCLVLLLLVLLLFVNTGK